MIKVCLRRLSACTGTRIEVTGRQLLMMLGGWLLTAAMLRHHSCLKVGLRGLWIGLSTGSGGGSSRGCHYGGLGKGWQIGEKGGGIGL